MSVSTVVFLTAAVLLVVAGAGKVVQPAGTVEAARSVGVPLSTLLGRLLAGVELAVGVLALLMEGWLPAGLVAGAYLLFAGFLVRGLVRGDLESCGCFVGDEAEPTPVHVVVDLVLAGSAVLVALTTAPATATSLISREPVGTTAGVLALVASASLLTYVVLSRLPQPVEVPERLRGSGAAG